MAKKQTKTNPAPVAAPVAPTDPKRDELTRKLYALAGDPDMADEFEAVRLELEALA